MRTFITGSSGYIGKRLLEVLTKRRDEIHALYRPGHANDQLPSGVTAFSGDILDPPSIERAMDGCDRAFHVAAYAKNWARDKQQFFATNVRGTTNVMQAALKLGLKKVVYTSTVMTLGPSNHIPVDESHTRTALLRTDYEASKLKAEGVVRTFADRGLEAVIVNPTRVFGHGLMTEGNSLTRMFKLYLDGTWRIIPGDGKAIGNYAYVDDIVLGHLLAMERGVSGERYILGGENVTFDTLFELVSQISGYHRRLVHIPGSILVAASHAEEWRARLLRGYPAITPGWMETFLLDSAYSCSKAERELGYHITPLRDALQQTLDWLMHRKERK